MAPGEGQKGERPSRTSLETWKPCPLPTLVSCCSSKRKCTFQAANPFPKAAAGEEGVGWKQPVLEKDAAAIEQLINPPVGKESNESQSVDRNDDEELGSLERRFSIS